MDEEKMIVVEDLFDSLSVEKSIHKFPALSRQQQRYVFKSALAQTSYGFTLHCWDARDHQDVCVKICIANECDEFDEKQILYQSIGGIQRETECLQFLNTFHHPQLMQYVDSFQDEWFHYLVTKLAVGVELISYSTIMIDHTYKKIMPEMINSKSLVMKEYQFFSQESFGYDPEHVRCLDQYLFQQLVQTVHFLHVHGVAHGDLAWENVMVSRDFQITLLDFGTAIQRMENNHENIRPFWSRFCLESSTKQHINPHFLTIVEKIWNEDLLDYVYTIDNDGIPFGHGDTAAPEMCNHDLQLVDLFSVDRYALGAILFLLSANNSIDKKLSGYFKSIMSHDWTTISSWNKEEMWSGHPSKASVSTSCMEVINGLIKPMQSRWDWPTLLNHPYIKNKITPDQLPQPKTLRRVTRSMAQFFST